MKAVGPGRFTRFENEDRLFSRGEAFLDCQRNTVGCLLVHSAEVCSDIEEGFPRRSDHEAMRTLVFLRFRYPRDGILLPVLIKVELLFVKDDHFSEGKGREEECGNDAELFHAFILRDTILVMKIFFSLLLLQSLAYGGVMKAIQIKIPKIGKTLSIKTENGVCEASGPRAYVVTTTTTGHALQCRVREPKFTYDSDIPVDVIENFRFPESVAEDMDKFEAGYGKMAKLIKQTKHKWGTEYVWSTPTSGSMTSHYICPKNSKVCVRVKVGGLERLTFDLL